MQHIDAPSMKVIVWNLWRVRNNSDNVNDNNSSIGNNIDGDGSRDELWEEEKIRNTILSCFSSLAPNLG